MNDFIEVLEFLYYSIIFFIIILFFSVIIDIVIKKIFLFDNDKHTYIFIEIFIIWICLSIILFYSKKLINFIPNPFGDTVISDRELIIAVALLPIVISLSVQNMRTKTTIIYKNIEDYFNNIL